MLFLLAYKKNVTSPIASHPISGMKASIGNLINKNNKISIVTIGKKGTRGVLNDLSKSGYNFLNSITLEQTSIYTISMPEFDILTKK